MIVKSRELVINTLVGRGLAYLTNKNRQALIDLMDANEIPRKDRNDLVKKARAILQRV